MFGSAFLMALEVMKVSVNRGMRLASGSKHFIKTPSICNYANLFSTYL